MTGAELHGVSASTRADEAPLPLRTAEDQAPTLDIRGRVDDRGAEDQGAGRHQAHLPASVIHELRTPLTSIHGYAQVLQRTLRNDPRATNAVAVLVRESMRLSAMLSELSELSELESGDVLATPIDVEVHQIVDGVVHEVSRRDAEAHPIAIEGSARASCNPTLLSQALLHVLTNATRYSDAGAPVDIKIARRGDIVEIVVEDRGLSIVPGDSARVYEPFERGANVREAGIRGLGLGLFLARRALQLIDGKISHESRAGGGSSFRIELRAV